MFNNLFRSFFIYFLYTAKVSVDLKQHTPGLISPGDLTRVKARRVKNERNDLLKSSEVSYNRFFSYIIMKPSYNKNYYLYISLFYIF